ncbi:MAG: DNA cytosine methyltransferase [Actinomycetota bacterium]|nr:DNA cytosine methyltransferase [Actinomycetota bacterium]
MKPGRGRTGGRRTAVSLFSGAGGLDLGVDQAGFDVIYAVESEPVAVQTLNRSRPKYFRALDAVEPHDITRFDPADMLDKLGLLPGDVDLLIGGPPCVAFSKSGFHLEYKRQGRDPRAGLLWDYLRFLDVLRPKAYLMENVFGLAYRNQSAPFFDGLRAGIRQLGYSLTYGVLNAADYGVPQNRQRLFLVGARDRRVLDLPSPTHWGDHERRRRPAFASELLPHVTAGDALSGLVCEREPGEDVNGKFGHLLPEIPPGRNYLHFTAHEGHPRPLFEWRSRYWTFLLKLDPERPASTIQAQPGPYVGPFHWDNRRLRVPELRRLHGFPDDFDFAGSRREVQVQIGNAVPPPLARTIATAIRKQLEGQAPTSRSEQLELAQSAAAN